MSNESIDIVFETYKVHVELAERVASLREGVNKLYSAMVTGIVSVSVLLYRVVPDAATTWVLPSLGVVILLSWMLSLLSVTGRLAAKNKVLSDLETMLPFDFLVREQREFGKRRFIRRGVTGMVIPVAFLCLCVAWLVMAIVGESSRQIGLEEGAPHA